MDTTEANGTMYLYSVAAVDAVGESAASSEDSATPTAGPTVPGAPQEVGAPVGDGSILLIWSAPTDDAGSPITSYTASASPGGASCSTTGALGCTVGGLANGTLYSFTVICHQRDWPGLASDPVVATRVGVPAAPTGLSASAGDSQVALDWSPPASDRGSPILRYTVTATLDGASCTTAATIR